MSRSLPTKRNPLISRDSAPSFEDLLGLRRLGKTKLTVKPGQVGTSNATKAENLGSFEYAHLRAPLPDDLSGSEIFATQSNQAHPETYFLMRRSKDGFVSATGMFKIAFPWATHTEEKEERDYLKSLDSTSQDEIAGNVWITPEFALELAEDYGLNEWVRALLDPSEISQTPSSTKKPINPPPKFDLPTDNTKLAPPAKAPRARSVRSASPSKMATPAKPGKAASPRKRQTKAQKEANLAHANAASASLQSALDDAASVAETETKPELAGPLDLAPAAHEETVKVQVDQSVEVDGTTETTHTNVTVEMPAGSPELPLPEDTEKMLETARKMVEEAKSLEASPKVTRKRKAQEPEPSDIDAELPIQPAKKARILEEKLKREKVRTRAVLGVTATLAIA
ncbi:transcription regulator HTH, apses-type DNA-binding domain-containing protein [Exophiala viscosa]|uniref:Cell pattern formation-associated protein stuA n=1 Tax=Exophiala viscosa TaxID=2486360 RepID=A0AAN6IAX4_9EURO|nr:transcription regulator HTH, apses-type DNA-binding domain-containing protein [Exophiala viscosa]